MGLKPKLEKWKEEYNYWSSHFRGTKILLAVGCGHKKTGRASPCTVDSKWWVGDKVVVDGFHSLSQPTALPLLPLAVFCLWSIFSLKIQYL